MRHARSRPGFTIIEAIAAVALSGIAISGGVLLFHQLDDETMRIQRESASVSRESNGERLLRMLLHTAEASVDTAERFRGDESSATCRSWCAVPAGWMERCQIVLSIDPRSDSSAIVATLSTGEQLLLAVHSGPAEFRYVDLLQRDSMWVRRWDRSISLPTAIALVRERDTLVFPLGAARD
jgi:hypothetical protein